jgi:phenylpropionate dioxygenase-like ring-hydroxylating dioxygenase large terminal subunit
MNVHAPVRPEAADGLLADLIARQPADHSLLQAFYRDPAIFREDLRRMLFRHWLCVGHASRVPDPGDYFLYEVAEESVIVVRGRDGQLRALVNVCRHRGSRVCTQASGRAKLLVCPYHAWVYNLDGSLRGARYMPDGFDTAANGLRELHLRVVEGLVFVSFADEPIGFGTVEATLTQAYGPYGWATAKVAHSETYTIAANWKLAVENYLECYHCTPSHPEYSKLHALEQPLAKVEGLNAALRARTCALGVHIAPVTAWHLSSQGEEAIRCFRYALYDGVATGSEGGAPVAPLMGAFSAYDGGVTSTHCGPASFFVAYADHGVLYLFRPKTVDVCEMDVIWLVRGEARAGVDYDVAKLTWLWRVTTEADKRITEDNQRGVNSMFYGPGPYAPMEYNLRAYIEWYLREMAG